MSATSQKSDSDVVRFPAPLQNLVRRAAAKNKDDITAGVDYAYNQLIVMSIYNAQLKEQLIRYALRELITDCRHSSNRRIKQSLPFDFSKVKHNQVHVASPSPSMSRVWGRWFDYMIAGRTLGSIMGSELQKIAESERRISDGHIKNADLLDALVPLVPANQTVKQALTDKQLGKLAKKYLKAA